MEVEVLVEGRGDDLTVALQDGSTMRIPRAWTDADGGETNPQPGRTAVFTVDALRDLLEVVEAFNAR